MAKRKAKPPATPAAAPSLRLEWRSPAELSANPRNWRRHPASQQAALAGVLSEVGWAGACLYNETTGLLIDGHLRQKVAMANGAEKIPVLVGAWTPEQEAKILATLDPLAAMADADPVALDALLREVNTGCAELQQMLADLWDKTQAEAIANTPAAPVDEDTPPEPQAAVVTRPGDLWTLGKHRLLCGDCRDAKAWDSLLQGERVNVCMTSPPYASQRKYDETSGFKPIKPDDYVAWWEPLQAFVKANMAGDGSFFVNIKPHCEDGERVLYVFDLVLAMRREWEWRFVDELCWKRKAPPGSWDNRLRNDFEPIYQFSPGSPSVRHGGISYKSDAVPVSGGGRNDHMGGHWNLSDELTSGTAHAGNLIECQGVESGTGHSAAFPVGLPSFFYRAFSDPADIVADPFMGSGTSMMAAEALGRQARGIEISPAYVDVCIRRFLAKYPDQPITRHDGKTWSQAEAASRE